MFKLGFKTDNAAFDYDNRRDEIARILADARLKVLGGHHSGRCIDVNGNRVGGWELTGEQDEAA